jgi:hypothetical protein
MPISERDLIQQWNAQADKFNQWESLDPGEQLVWAQARAIAADRNRRPKAAPEPGEVSEIAAELLFHVGFMHSQDKEGWPVDLDLPPLLTRAAELLQQLSALAPVVVPVAISGEQWHEDDGDCLWWRFPIEEPPWYGNPRDDEWPGYYTHFTRIVFPLPQDGEVQP